MRAARLERAFPEPPAGRVLIMGASGAEDLSMFRRGDTVIETGLAAEHQDLAAQGWTVTTGATAADGPFDHVVVTLPRARAAGRALIARAASLLAPGGSLWIDGQKTDGVEAMLREVAGLAPIAEIHAKAHGKLARLDRGDWVPEDWGGRDLAPAAGFRARAGMFSADAPDPGSVLLAAHLPKRMPTRVVDLGAGWGWLAAQVLGRPGVELLHLVEADHDALQAARDNIGDPRARFHWQDARRFRLAEPVNGVVMNPPFHSGRAADPSLGAAFIQAAADLLTSAGTLWMVANRHLPYEAVLAERFGQVEQIAGNPSFKVIAASGARRARSRK